MNKLTKEAIEGSIKKWEAIVDGSGEDLGQENCPLCELFAENGCKGCPVYERVERKFCANTPYTQWVSLQFDSDGHYEEMWRANTPARMEAALKELKFLRSLL